MNNVDKTEIPYISDDLKKRMVNFFIEKGVFQEIYEQRKTELQKNNSTQEGKK